MPRAHPAYNSPGPMRNTRTTRATSPPPGIATDEPRPTRRRLRRPRASDRPETGKKLDLPVEWTENAPRRPGFAAEYVSIGSLPGILHRHLAKANRLRKVLCQTLVLSNSSRSLECTTDARFTSSLLIKVLRRGRTPLATLGVERAALKAGALTDQVAELGEDSHEVGWNGEKLNDALSARADTILAQALRKRVFTLDPSFDGTPGDTDALVDSDAEAVFLKRWVPEALGPEGGHWFTPQAPLDTLLEAAGLGDGSGARRCDFLFCHPAARRPFTVELDGPEHDPDADRVRDKELHDVGIDVVRVTNDEVMRGRGPALDLIQERCRTALEAFPPAGHSEPAALAIECAKASKVQFALARAVEYGWLTGGAEWRVTLTGAGAAAAGGVTDALDMIAALDALYGTRTAPRTCTVHAGDNPPVTWPPDAADKSEAGEPAATANACDELRIAVEFDSSPFDAIDRTGEPDFIIRPASIPPPMATRQSYDRNRRPAVAETYADARPALTLFLQNIFRKRDFRPFQGEAILNALKQNDSVVLLPTGGGKSIIYQLSGLLQPGVTLVVDPINALIDDQLHGLREYGVDLAIGITGDLDRRRREHLLYRMERDQFLFVLHSPERLQSPQFRAALTSLAESSVVNLAVIDEAHCVSEWGHDFRPSYLNVGRTLRKIGAGSVGDGVPRLLALTGTASRAVLRDMLNDLDIDQRRSEALIRPDSFDRPELKFEIRRTSPREDARSVLRGTMNGLPRKLNGRESDFFRPNDAKTAAGIVFVPTVTGQIYGVRATQQAIQKATGAEVTVYSGGKPDEAIAEGDWTRIKKENAAAFKNNKIAILVATKAFGMGIDKPNIRYTVHFGMPMSLEGLYQEAGRAGRDHRHALSTTIFSEYDPVRTDRLLHPEIDIDEMRRRLDEEAGDRRTADDVTRTVWFHLNSYKGIKEDVAAVESLLGKFKNLSANLPAEIPFTESTKNATEKAIYQLVKVGIIQDYEVDFGGKKFLVHTAAYDRTACRTRVLDYIRATSPGKVEAFRQKLAETGAADTRDEIVALTRVLVEFTYDEIERSRRRSMMEAVQLGRHATNDAEIRRRVLDYLQEGLGSEYIRELLAAETVKFRISSNECG